MHQIAILLILLLFLTFSFLTADTDAQTISTADYTVTANTFSGADLGQKVEAASADVITNTLLTGTARTRTCSVAVNSTALTCSGGFSFGRDDVGLVVSGGNIGTVSLIAATDSATSAVLSKPSAAAITSVALTFTKYKGGKINIVSDNSAANITTAINNYPNITYNFGIGDFKFNLPAQDDVAWIDAPLMAWDNSKVIGQGDGTRLKTSNTALRLYAPKLTLRKNPSSLNRFEFVTYNIYLGNLQILGDATTFDSLNFAVGTGNARNAVIERVYFNGVTTLGLGLGGFIQPNSPSQSWGFNQTVRFCRFENVFHNNLAIVNNERVEIYNNYFGSISQPAATTGGISFIDGEPNSGLSRMLNISVENNEFYAQNLLNTKGNLKEPLGAAINFVYPSSAANLDYAAGLVIKNNRVIGGNVYYYGANGARGEFAYAQIAAGIHVDSYQDVTISDNEISWTSQDSIYCGAGKNFRIINNNLAHNGSDFHPVVLDTTTDSIIKNNIIGTSNNNTIAEVNGKPARNNYFENNRGAAIKLLAGSNSRNIEFKTDGNGAKFLADDGTYKDISGTRGAADRFLVSDISGNVTNNNGLYLVNRANTNYTMAIAAQPLGFTATFSVFGSDKKTLTVTFPKGSYVVLNNGDILTDGGTIKSAEQGATIRFVRENDVNSSLKSYIVESYRGSWAFQSN